MWGENGQNLLFGVIDLVVFEFYILKDLEVMIVNLVCVVQNVGKVVLFWFELCEKGEIVDYVVELVGDMVCIFFKVIEYWMIDFKWMLEVQICFMGFMMMVWMYFMQKFNGEKV